MGLLRIGGAVVLSLVVVVGGLFATGVIGVPSGGVDDAGDWGEVEQERTEIVTSLWVHNPNPFGVQTGAVRADYEVAMNGVTVATGQKEGIDIDSGNNSVTLRTYVDNDKLQPWWVEYVRANETITMAARGEVTVGTPVGQSTVDLPTQEKRMLEDKTPVISGLSAAASQLEGDYTRSVAGPQACAGYQIEDAWAEWGNVTRNETTVLINYEVTNPCPVPVPAVPDGLSLNVSMNDVEMFAGGMDEMEPRDVDRGALIEEGETQTVTLAVTMDNDKIDDWFRSHVRNDEQTDMEVRLSLLFRSERTDTTFRVPRDGASSVECDIQTAILVDDQESETDCGAAAT